MPVGSLERRPVAPAGRQILRGPAAVLLAATLWGTTGTAQALGAGQVDPLAVGAARLVVGGLVLALIGLPGGALRTALTGGPRRWAVLLAGVAGVAGYQEAFFSAVARTGVAVGTVVAIGSAPVLTGLLARLTGSDRLGPRWWAATAGAVAGASLLTAAGRTGGVVPAGVLLGLLAGLCYASYAVISSRLIVAGVPGRGVVAVLFGGAGVVLLPVMVGTGPGWLGSPRGLLTAAYLGLVTTVLAYLLYARALRRTPVATASTLGLLEPAVATVLGVVVLGERLGPVAVVGLGLVGASLVLVAAGAHAGVPGGAQGGVPGPP